MVVVIQMTFTPSSSIEFLPMTFFQFQVTVTISSIFSKCSLEQDGICSEADSQQEDHSGTLIANFSFPRQDGVWATSARTAKMTGLHSKTVLRYRIVKELPLRD